MDTPPEPGLIEAMQKLIGDGAGEYLDLTDPQTVALIAVLSYLGPRGICAALERWWVSRKTP